VDAFSISSAPKAVERGAVGDPGAEQPRGKIVIAS
jgi:hypothetical protein